MYIYIYIMVFSLTGLRAHQPSSLKPGRNWCFPTGGFPHCSLPSGFPLILSRPSCSTSGLGFQDPLLYIRVFGVQVPYQLHRLSQKSPTSATCCFDNCSLLSSPSEFPFISSPLTFGSLPLWLFFFFLPWLPFTPRF